MYKDFRAVLVAWNVVACFYVHDHFVLLFNNWYNGARELGRFEKNFE